MTTLTDEVRELLAAASEVSDGPRARQLTDLADRLDDPLRLAIVGRVKAGKSTLLNALVGEAVAPTDAAECTRVVTWYVDGVTYRAWLHPVDGDPRQVPFTREPGNAHIDVSGEDLEAIDHLRVEFPSQHLDGLNLIDTPGTASVSEAVAARTSDLLLDDVGTEVDVAVYLMRHLYEGDVDFLEAFVGDDRDARPTMAIGVLSRADEIGGGRSDALAIAGRAAAAYAQEPRLRAKVQTVIPVAGLLAFTAATLREAEFQHLRTLARYDIVEIDSALSSADAFVAGSVIGVGTEDDRLGLVERLGMHGIRFAVAQILHRRVSSASELASALRAHSGLDRLRTVVRGLYAERRAVLKADLALSVVADVARHVDASTRRRLDGEIERIRATSYEFAELDALHSLRITPPEDLEPSRRQEAERILGASGTTVEARLDVGRDLDDEDVRHHVLELLGEWRSMADRPLASRELRTLGPVVAQTLERLYGDLDTTP